MLEKVSLGDKLNGHLNSAENWNALMDVARRGQPQGPSEAGGWGGNTYTVVNIKNNSGSAVNRYGILGLDGFLITPTQNPADFRSNFALKGITPTVASHRGKFVLMLDACPIGAMGSGLLVGSWVCQIDVVNTSHTRADVKNNDRDKLQSNSHGSAVIIDKESGTGTKWAAVTLGNALQGCLGKTDASHAKGASGTVSLYSGTPGSEADTTENVTAFNKFATLASGKWVWIEWQDGNAYLVAGEC